MASVTNPDKVDELDYECRLNNYKELVKAQDINEDRDEYCVSSTIVSLRSKMNTRPTIFLSGNTLLN